MPARQPKNGPIARETVLGLDTVTAQYIRKVLDLCNGRVEGEQGAARLLRIHPSTLRKRMKRLGIPFGRHASA
jgi:transcriptional regulator with GAF, ATPase, and Fis domain